MRAGAARPHPLPGIGRHHHIQRRVPPYGGGAADTLWFDDVALGATRIGGTVLDVLGGVAAGGHRSLRVVLRDHPDRLPALRDRITAALGGRVGAPPPDAG
ncbi:hypothetical protein Nm8I071_26940 [Nonomuraea sp. TT08I-71]|nr:hypothetical protein Nm8I071_26940 [Nonomuraea sp. TT08I-71]